MKVQFHFFCGQNDFWWKSIFFLSRYSRDIRIFLSKLALDPQWLCYYLCFYVLLVIICNCSWKFFDVFVIAAFFCACILKFRLKMCAVNLRARAVICVYAQVRSRTMYSLSFLKRFFRIALYFISRLLAFLFWLFSCCPICYFLSFFLSFFLTFFLSYFSIFSSILLSCVFLSFFLSSYLFFFRLLLLFCLFFCCFIGFIFIFQFFLALWFYFFVFYFFCVRLMVNGFGL
jgi:hypothetical protein